MVYGEKEITILVDQCIPTKERIKARRPDLVIRMIKEKTIIIMEVACAWEPIVKRREAQEKAKYGELAADLANQWPGYTIRNTPVVMGTLGLVTGARKALLGTRLWGREGSEEVGTRSADKCTVLCSTNIEKASQSELRTIMEKEKRKINTGT